MPLYEEKLISPLAIRFTQEHIRTTFRDRRSVEATVDEIKAVQGSGDYDVILSFPFPAIEVMRYRAAERGNSNVSDLSKKIGEEAEGSHWFTLDNRRLYCLQRAAVKLWPLRVAARVDALYADDGSGRKKCDTTSYGCSVTISSSIKDPNFLRWDWRVAALPQHLVSVGQPGCEAQFTNQVKTLLTSILADDQKDVDDLLEAPAEQVMPPPAFHALPATAAAKAVGPAAHFEEATCGKSQARSRTPSTAASSDESEGDLHAHDVKPAGHPVAKASKQQHRCRSREPRVSGGKVNQAFTSREQEWWAQEAAESWYNSWYDDLAAAAITEIEAQLQAPDNEGFVWIDNWNAQYLHYLGTLRNFLESRPDKFTVVPGKGKGYRVTLASYVPAQSNRNHWRPKARNNGGKIWKCTSAY